jgi:hypothetical protein
MNAYYINKFRWRFRKNWPDFIGILGKRYPNFVVSNRCETISTEIPIFVFHNVEPVTFEKQLEFLHQNEYQTINGDELLAIILRNQKISPKTVVLTFDDGSASLYSVAFPLLKKYGFKGTCFILPGCITDTAPVPSTYKDYLEGKVSAEDLISREFGDFPLCSWEEILEMDKTGVIDFQAHSMYHHLIPVSPQVIDFMHPGFDKYYFSNIKVPVYHHDFNVDYNRDVKMGTPVYRNESRMSGLPQYFDNIQVRESCIDYVENHGGVEFFNKKKWRSELNKFYSSQKKKYPKGKFETKEEVYFSILNEFKLCKNQIEKKMSGKQIYHFCLPWFIGSKIATEAAVAAGFKAIYWGTRYDVRTNRPGNDPLKLVRLDARYIYRLPGKNRKSLADIVKSNLISGIKKSTNYY